MTDDTTDQPRRVPWVSDEQAPVYQLPRRRHRRPPPQPPVDDDTLRRLRDAINATTN
ncbi:hypothetical protein [Gordonia sputi]